MELAGKGGAQNVTGEVVPTPNMVEVVASFTGGEIQHDHEKLEILSRESAPNHRRSKKKKTIVLIKK